MLQLLPNTIILDEPSPFQTTFNTSDYNGFNISCFGSLDGFIDQTTNRFCSTIHLQLV